MQVIPDNNGVTADQLNAIDGVAQADPSFDTLYSEALSMAGNTGFSDPANPTTSEVNRVIYSVNDLGDVITNGDQASSTVNDLTYADSGINNVTPTNVDGITAQVETGDFTDFASIQTLVDDYNAIVDDINGNGDSTSVTATQLNGISGVNTADPTNDALYAESLGQATATQFSNPNNPTGAEINAVVNAVNSLSSVITTQTGEESLAPQQFTDAGIDGVSSTNLDFVQSQVATGTLTSIQAIDDMVTGYNAILDQVSNGLGGTGVSATNLNSIEGVSTADPSNDALYSEAIAISTTSFDNANEPTATELADLVEAVNVIADVRSGSGLVTDINIDLLLDAGIQNVNTDTLQFVREQVSTGQSQLASIHSRCSGRT